MLIGPYTLHFIFALRAAPRKAIINSEGLFRAGVASKFQEPVQYFQGQIGGRYAHRKVSVRKCGSGNKKTQIISFFTALKKAIFNGKNIN